MKILRIISALQEMIKAKGVTAMPEEKKKLRNEGLDAINPIANEASTIMALGYVLPANLVHNQESNRNRNQDNQKDEDEHPSPVD